MTESTKEQSANPEELTPEEKLLVLEARIRVLIARRAAYLRREKLSA